MREKSKSQLLLTTKKNIIFPCVTFDLLHRAQVYLLLLMKTLSAEKHLVSQFKLAHCIMRMVSAKGCRLFVEQRAPVLPRLFVLINSSCLLPSEKFQTIFLLHHLDGSTEIS